MCILYLIITLFFVINNSSIRAHFDFVLVFWSIFWLCSVCFPIDIGQPELFVLLLVATRLLWGPIWSTWSPWGPIWPTRSSRAPMSFPSGHCLGRFLQRSALWIKQEEEEEGISVLCCYILPRLLLVLCYVM